MPVVLNYIEMVGIISNSERAKHDLLFHIVIDEK